MTYLPLWLHQTLNARALYCFSLIIPYIINAVKSCCSWNQGRRHVVNFRGSSQSSQNCWLSIARWHSYTSIFQVLSFGVSVLRPGVEICPFLFGCWLLQQLVYYRTSRDQATSHALCRCDLFLQMSHVVWSAYLSVCLSGTWVRPAKPAEPIEMPFGGWLTWGHLLDGIDIPLRKGPISGVVGPTE